MQLEIKGGIAVIEMLRSMAKERVIAKRTFLFRQGEPTGSFFYVQEGLLKAFYETRDGRLQTKTFVKEGGFIASMKAVFHGEACSFSTVCLEDSRVLEISRSDLMRASELDPQFVNILNSILLKVASTKEQREYELLCLSAEERYLLFCERESDLLERLSQEDIARYLGITPVSLSRIRKRRLSQSSL